MVVGGLPSSLLNFRGPLLRSLVANGHDVVAIAASAPLNVVQTLKDWGVSFFPIPLARASLNPMGDLRTLTALWRLIKQEEPERILAYTIKPVIYANLAARLAGGAPVYSMITGLGYGFGDSSGRQRWIGRVVQTLYRHSIKNSAGVFFMNPDDLSVFQKKLILPPKVPITLINGTGVDLDWYVAKPLPERAVFLLVARLIAEKGVREYVSAARLLRAKYPGARFCLAGDLDENPMSVTQQELRKWQADGVIDYLGRMDDIRPAFTEARVFVLPSYYREGQPRTILEAMAMGRPVITTDSPGCRETVQHGFNGFLVPVRDVEALRLAMERFIVKPDLAPQMGKNSLEIAREKYDVHKVNQVILKAMEL